MANNLYEIAVYSENQVGLLSTIANIFTRRSLNIESLRVYPSGVEGIHRFIIKTRAEEDEIMRVCKSIEKKVDVLKAFYYIDDERRVMEMAAVKSLIEERTRENNQ